MADEEIVVSVTDGGSTLSVIELLQQLGLEGEEAGARVASGNQNLSNSLITVANSEKIVSAARQAGVTDTTNLRTALDLLTNSEQKTAASAESLASFVAALRTALTGTAPAAQQAATEMTEAAAAADRLGFTSAAAARILAGLATAETEAGAGATAMAAGEARAETAAAGLGTSVTGVFGAIGGLTGAFGKAALAIGVFVGVQATIHASDEYTKIINQLTLATGSAKGASDEFAILENSANSTGTEIGATAALFTRLRTTTDESTASTNTLNQAVTGIQVGLKLAGTSGQETTRVLKELTEISSGAANGQKQFNSILANSPGFVKELKDAGYDLQAENDKQSLKVAALKERYQELQDKLVGVTGNYRENVTSVQSLSLENEKLNLSLSRVTNAHASNAVAAKNNATQASILTQEIQSNNVKINQNNAYLQANKDAYDRKNTAEATSLQAQIKDAEATGNNTEQQKKLYAALGVLASAHGDLVRQQLTVSDTLTILSNKFVQFIGTSQSVGKVIDNLKQGILLLANNLETVGRVVEVFLAALVVQKLVAFATALGSVGTALKALGVVIAANPYTALAIAIAAIIGYYTDWKTVLDNIQPALAILKDTLDTFFLPILAQFQPLIDSFTGTGQAATTFGGILTAVVSAGLNTVILLVKNFIVGLSLLIEAAVKTGQAIASFINGAIDLFDKLVTNGKASFAELSAAWKQVGDGFNSVVEYIKGVLNSVVAYIQPIIDKITQLIQALQSLTGLGGGGAGTGTGTGGGLGHARSGLSYVVGGSGGVDSTMVPIMASPGERVTIQTPQQQHVNGIPHFRDGGGFDVGTGDGVSLGLSGVSVQSASSSTSVPGYSATALKALTDASTDQTTAVNDNTTAVSTLTDTLTAVTDTSGTSATTDTSDATTDPTSTTSSYSPFVGFASVASTSTDDTSSTDTSSSTDTTTAKPRPTESDIYAAYEAVTGVPVPPDGFNVQSTVAQAQTYVDENGHWVPRSSISGQVSVALKRAGFRDGGSFLVGGSGGVDSQAMNLAVSPGERVSVETAQQQAANDRTSSAGSVTNVFHIKTPDVKGFGNSRAQISANIARASRIANRRVKG